MNPHFLKEEEYALPPLGLLTLIAEGKVSPDKRDVLGMTDRLKAELHEMLEEHKAIISALKELSDVVHPCRNYFTAEEKEAILKEEWKFDKNLVHQIYKEKIGAWNTNSN